MNEPAGPGRRILRALQPAARPVSVILVGAAVTALLWWLLARAEDAAIARLVETEARLVAGLAREGLDHHALELLGMARRWEQRPDPAEADWKVEVQEVMRETPALRGIEWREPDLVLRWAAPKTAVQPGADLDSTRDDLRRAALLGAPASPGRYVSASVPGPEGHRHVLIAVPMLAKGQTLGYLVGAARVRDAVDAIVRDELGRGFSVAVYEGPYLVYGPVASSEGPEAVQFSRTDGVAVGGLRWRIEVWPSPELARRLRSPMPEVVLVLGAFAAVMAGAVFAVRTPALPARSSEEASVSPESGTEPSVSAAARA